MCLMRVLNMLDLVSDVEEKISFLLLVILF